MLAECKGLQAATETTRGRSLIQSQLRLFNTNLYPARETIGRAAKQQTLVSALFLHMFYSILAFWINQEGKVEQADELEILNVSGVFL